MKKLLLSCVAFATLSGTAYAQDDPGRNPTVTYLMQQYDISEQKAQERIDLQLDIAEMAQSIMDRNIPGYIGLYIQHEPNFKVEVLFEKDLVDGKFNKNDLIEELTRDQQKGLRPHVRVRKVNRSSQSISEDTQSLSSVFNSTDIPYIGGFDFQSLKFNFTASTIDEVDILQDLVPADLLNDVEFDVGSVPTVQNVSGQLPGDTIIGGDTIRVAANTTAPRCTLGYAVNYNAGGIIRQGILTAGHCQDTMFYNVNGHFVTLGTPLVIQRDQVGKYDYQVWDVTGLPTNFSITFRDLNGIPEFPSTGTLDLVNTTSFNNQFAGMVVCKSGAVTGITCGQIINGNATYNGVPGYIRVSQTLQGDISAPGDSGAPWFLYPGFSRNIIGVGIHTAGGGTGTGSTAVYMPIDYINDHNTSIVTIKK